MDMMKRLLAIAILILLCARTDASVTALAAGSDLQAAVNAAAPGDTLLLPAGATFTGPLRLPLHAGGYITITTAGFPVGAGKRVAPGDAPGMAKIVAPGANQGAVVAMASAHHWKLIGLEIMPATAATVCSQLVQLGEGDPTLQTDLSQVPHDLILDRCYIHGWPTDNILKRGVCLQCGYAEVRNCWISDIHRTDVDTQAVAGWNGPGPFVIDNCELEAAGENILFGGSDPGIPNLTPSDIIVSNNHIFKPLSWRVGDPSYAGIHWLVKNLFEIKNAQRVTVDHNLFENNWVDGQAGFAINLKSSNQTGAAPWSVCRDVCFTGNIIRHSASGIGIGRDPFPVVLPSHISFRGNTLYDISGPAWGAGGAGTFLQLAQASYVTVDRNVVSQTGMMVSPYGPQMVGFVFTGNTINHSTYGVKAPGMTPGTASLNAVWGDSWTFERNVIVAHPAVYPPNLYPAGNEWPDGWGDLAAEVMGANR